VRAPTLLVVGGEAAALEVDRVAQGLLRCECRVAMVPGAGHRFEQPDAMEEAIRLSTAWFRAYLTRPERRRPAARARGGG
jgi:putative phosphoribosyl transferase